MNSSRGDLQRRPPKAGKGRGKRKVAENAKGTTVSRSLSEKPKNRPKNYFSW